MRDPRDLVEDGPYRQELKAMARARGREDRRHWKLCDARYGLGPCDMDCPVPKDAA